MKNFPYRLICVVFGLLLALAGEFAASSAYIAASFVMGFIEERDNDDA